MTYDSVIVDSHVVTPKGIVDKNIIIDEGKIVGLTNDVPSCDAKINANGLASIPGIIDTHVHYGVYSSIDQAARTESHAAAIGGITTMMRMLRLSGSIRAKLQAHLDASAMNHHVDYTVHQSIFNEKQVEEMPFCVEKGIPSFKIYMNLADEIGHVYMDIDPYTSSLDSANVNVDDFVVESVVKKAASLNCPVLVHAEDYEGCACGIRTAKERRMDGLGAWSSSRSPDNEAKAIAKVSAFARKYDCIVYFVHIGSKIALEQITKERSHGTKIFVETCPHYMVLSHEKQQGYLAKVMPPIRTQHDNTVVWQSLQNNQIETIGTDHVANQLKLKLGGDDVWGVLAGFPGIGTILSLLLSEGVNKDRLNIEQLVRLTSTNAAKIFSMYPKKGVFMKDSDADITLVDLKLEKKVTPDLFGGFSDYSVYEGMKLKGWPVKTIVRGELVAENFAVVGKTGFGQLVKRHIG